MSSFKNEIIEKMYNAFSRIPYFWEVDSIMCKATENSPYRSTLIRNLKLSNGSNVLDMACGTGLNIPLLHDVVGSGGRIVGVDNSEKTATIARKRITRKRWDNVSILKMDGPKYQAESLHDAALCTFAIEIIPPYKETINTMINSVKSGGRIGLIGFKYSNNKIIKLLNPIWKMSCIFGGGVDLERNVPEYLRHNLKEVMYKEVYAGFYYIGIYEK
jgi:demethylmenaquinone methyltransferase/2-methoxy-6-polyprenyl-1,4-benzoquinol methylase